MRIDLIEQINQMSLRGKTKFRRGNPKKNDCQILFGLLQLKLRNDVKFKNIFSFFPFSLRPTRVAFTLSEVLITLGIIGVVAALVIPALNNQIQNMEFKTAYKKAYSDMNQAFAQAIADQSMVSRSGTWDNDASDSEWAVLKGAMKVTKECSMAELNQCWAIGEPFYNSYPNTTDSRSFTDSSGRSWAEYYHSENIYLVDTNGFKSPNRFGKDRWMFTFWDANNSRVGTGLPVKVGVMDEDITTINANVCHYPPCYFRSWLFD